MKKIIVALFICILTVSCSKKNNLQEIQVDTKHSIEVPTGLAKTSDLHPQAIVQFKDANKELYLITIKEPIVDVKQFFEENKSVLDKQFTADLKGYADLSYIALLEKAKVENPVSLTYQEINGAKAYVAEFDALVSGLNIFYNFAVVESGDSYYQVLVWTLNTKKQQNKVDMGKIVHSFKDNNNR